MITLELDRKRNCQKVLTMQRILLYPIGSSHSTITRTDDKGVSIEI